MLVLIPVWLSFPVKILAKNENGHDLVNAVNALRASQGLKPYKIDSWLMNYAQKHSEYQASIQTSTHVHSDGSLPQSIGVQENVASGTEGVINVSIVVYEIWVDSLHRGIMVNSASGFIGAGVATSQNGQVYYTLNIRPGGQQVNPTQGAQNPVSATSAPSTFIPLAPLETSAPREDGSVVHTVGYGQSLWTIAEAYKVTVDEIRRLNGIASDSSDIYVNQTLLIRLAQSVLPTQTTESVAVGTDKSLVTEASATESPALLTTPSLTSVAINISSADPTPSMNILPPTAETTLPSMPLPANIVLMALVLLVIVIMLALGFLGFRE